ncbi:TIM-barrel domain-containing protein [Thalassotalea atypica]|uniref:glycoside hydrolase family 31 protein n=1 Tax=Thalassotalea atypica TaxID=2054316 RepID=UPI0025724CB9|nr:TIM-barrel domain-containing protein [Thalassotalea atypica]
MLKVYIKVMLTLCIILLTNSLAYAGYLSHLVKGSVVTVQGELAGKPRSFQIQAHHNNAFEIVFDNVFHQQLPSYAIAHSKSPSLSVKDSDQALIIDTNALRLIIDKKTLRLSYYQDDNLLLKEEQGFFSNKGSHGFRFKLADNEKIMGGGERVIGMDRRGHKLPLYNKAHYGYTTESKQMYFGLPAIMSDKKYMIIFDNSARGEMDIGASEHDILSFQAIAGRSSYIVVAGKSYPELINNYVDLTGKQPMPPRWALGNFASRFGYHTEQEVRNTVKAFQQEDIPLDAIVLDLYWFGKDIQGHMGNLAWDKQAFPTPQKMISDLQNDGVNTIVITEPFILTTSNNWQSALKADALAVKPQSSKNISNNKREMSEGSEPYTFDFYFGHTGLVDVFNQRGQAWFKQAYQTLYQQGVTGWWGDLGEPEVHPDDIIHRFDNGTEVTGAAVHNAYGHQWAKMVYQNQQEIAPNSRAMIMMRSGFVGSQRYGMIPWTGDVSRSWGGLKPQVELSLQMGLFGLAYTHSDLGGFAGGEKFDAQMYTRWLQYGVFQPVYRPHAQEAIAPEPVFHDQQTKDIVREFIKLRYQLLPYNYTLAYENSISGMPLMRPLFFEDELDVELIAEKETYLWGDAFLVTPVTDPDSTSIEVNVPNGQWFDFWTDERITGGQQFDYPVSLSTIPVLVRAGSFIPMIKPINTTQAYRGDELFLHYYHDSSVPRAYGQMYDDDGKSSDAIASERFQRLTFDASYIPERQLSAKNDSKAELTISLKKSGLGYQGMPTSRRMNLVIHHWDQAANAVDITGQYIPIVNSQRALKLATQAAFWDQSKNTLTITFDWGKAAQRITIK